MFISDQTCNFFEFLSFSEEFDTAETDVNRQYRSVTEQGVTKDIPGSADLFYSFCGC